MSATATTYCDTSVKNIFSRRFRPDSTTPPYLDLSNSQHSTALSSPPKFSAVASEDFFSTVPRSARSSSPLDSGARETFIDSSTFASLPGQDESAIAELDFGMASNFEYQQPVSSSFQQFHPGVAFSQAWSNNGGVGREANSIEALSRANAHMRSPSVSTIGSNAGRYQQAQTIRTGASRKNQNSSSRPQSSTDAHLPTPSSTPTRKNFSHNTQHTPQHLETVDLLMNHHLYPRQHHSQNDDASEMSHSNRPSFSSVGQDPVTPMTAVSDYRDDALRTSHGADSMTNSSLPKLERTLTDAYNDELYFQQPMHAPAPPTNPNPNYLMAGGNKLVQDRLQAAAMARSPSSSSNQSAVSHYKPYLPTQMRGGRRDTQDTDYQVSPRTESEPKTISPKEAMLDYKSTENETPLFTQASSDFSFAVAPAVAKPFQTSTTMPFAMGPWSTDIQQSALTSAPVPSYGAFAQPTMPASYGMPMGHHGSALAAPQFRRVASKQSENPEFPAHLTSMESSASESGFPGSSQASSLTVSTPKPDSSADTGTYSCTYHGCSQRFTTPQKLQKHKRDAHRASTNVTPGVGSGMSAAQLMERNSQTGPHKCERINPTTGKPCNTVFSRPYDLTRHEDTIHNIRKQKVRCALCTEDKTFSRADALTRHMRVVHPEVDFPGKHRKRGGRGD